MGILSFDINNINHDDINFDEDDLETFSWQTYDLA